MAANVAALGANDVAVVIFKVMPHMLAADRASAGVVVLRVSAAEAADRTGIVIIEVMFYMRAANIAVAILRVIFVRATVVAFIAVFVNAVAVQIPQSVGVAALVTAVCAHTVFIAVCKLSRIKSAGEAVMPEHGVGIRHMLARPAVDIIFV